MKDTPYDGVICFGGEDWWYHNRGHFDLQMMREFSKHVPVLYINSLGMRIPKVTQDSAFLKRIFRKLRSMLRNFVKINESFGVLSLFSIPGHNHRLFIKMFMLHNIKRARKKMGISNPIVWAALPSCLFLLQHISYNALIYQRTDRFETEDDVDYGQSKNLDLMLKDKADLTVFCTRHVFNEEHEECRRAVYIDHGVDYAKFADAGAGNSYPSDLPPRSGKKVVGFVGGMDPITIDQELVARVVALLPDYQFFFVGHDNLPENWCNYHNAVFTGIRPYEMVPQYMSAADVLIMPWRQNEWIKACNPVKLKEYLAVGRPVVSTYFPELEYYKGLVTVATTPDEFARAIKESIADEHLVKNQRSRVATETWTAKYELISEKIQKLIEAKGESV